jgi:hypothetical protein
MRETRTLNESLAPWPAAGEAFEQFLERIANFRIIDRGQEFFVDLTFGCLSALICARFCKRFFCCRVDAAYHEENILHDVLLETLIELVGNHIFHELQLLHPHRAADLYEKRPVTNFFGLGIAGNGIANDFVPNRPDAVLIQPRRQVEPFQRLIEDRAHTL